MEVLIQSNLLDSSPAAQRTLELRQGMTFLLQLKTQQQQAQQQQIGSQVIQQASSQAHTPPRHKQRPRSLSHEPMKQSKFQKQSYQQLHKLQTKAHTTQKAPQPEQQIQQTQQAQHTQQEIQRTVTIDLEEGRMDKSSESTSNSNGEDESAASKGLKTNDVATQQVEQNLVPPTPSPAPKFAFNGKKTNHVPTTATKTTTRPTNYSLITTHTSRPTQHPTSPPHTYSMPNNSQSSLPHSPSDPLPAQVSAQEELALQNHQLHLTLFTLQVC